MAFLEWLQQSWLGRLVAESLWGYPTFETMHTIGMALLIGSLGLINLRVLGYKPELPLLGTRDLLPLAWLGFTINAISGAALFASDAVNFFSSYTFWTKIVLVILGGINAAVLSSRIFGGGVAAPPTVGARVIAASSLVFWMGAVVAGRLIAYTPPFGSIG